MGNQLILLSRYNTRNSFRLGREAYAVAAIHVRRAEVEGYAGLQVAVQRL